MILFHFLRITERNTAALFQFAENDVKRFAVQQDATGIIRFLKQKFQKVTIGSFLARLTSLWLLDLVFLWHSIPQLCILGVFNQFKEVGAVYNNSKFTARIVLPSSMDNTIAYWRIGLCETDNRAPAESLS